MKFELNRVEAERANAFIKAQDAKVSAQQGTKIPYYGAASGAYSYIFTPTSVGTMIKIQNCITREEQDITDLSVL